MTTELPRSRQQIRTARRLAEIVNVAAKLFDQAGYSSTSMEDIARAMGIAKPTLYHYFRSKDEILRSIHEEFIDLLLERHEHRLRVGMAPGQLLLEVMGDILELMETHRGHVRVFFEHHRELPEDVREQVRRKRDRYESMVTDVIQRGVAEGAFRDIDPHLGALGVFGMCNWAYQWYRPGGPLRTRDIAYAFWSYFIHGVASPALREGDAT